MAYNILIVDDSLTILAVMKKTIQMSGIDAGQVFQAENGRDALDILDREWIDVMFADIHMPVMGGVELVQILARNKILKNLPVIMVSTEGSRTRIGELVELGIRDFIRKPITPEIVKNSLDKIFTGRPE